MWLIFICVILSVFILTEINQTAERKWFEKQYQQSDYLMTMDIAELTFSNASFVRGFNLAFTHITRTLRGFSVNVTLLVDVMDIRIDMQMYKFLSNEYRFFPMTVSVHFCRDVYNTNLFSGKELLANCSNVHCPLLKGFFHLHNCLPDNSKLPPYIPHGSYKMVWTAYDTKGTYIAKLETQGRALETPLPWTN